MAAQSCLRSWLLHEGQCNSHGRLGPPGQLARALLEGLSPQLSYFPLAISSRGRRVVGGLFAAPGRRKRYLKVVSTHRAGLLCKPAPLRPIQTGMHRARFLPTRTPQADG